MAFSTGLLGSGHCLGMCGGIVAAFSLATGGGGSLFFPLLYQIGRILTYMLIGLVVGTAGSALAFTDSLRLPGRMLLLSSDVFLILIGLGSAGLFSRLAMLNLEYSLPVGTLTATVQRLKALPSYLSALPLGMVFGLLPCGLVYAMAITAAQSSAASSGALIMLAFGLGTAPALLLFGSTAHLLSARARQLLLRAAGLMVAAMGLYQLVRHLRLFYFLPPCCG
jgi:sulfite exporter TauE/SafE